MDNYNKEAPSVDEILTATKVDAGENNDDRLAKLLAHKQALVSNNNKGRDQEIMRQSFMAQAKDAENAEGMLQR